MLFLLTGFDCGGETVLTIIKYVMQLLNILYFIVPIGLIVMLSVDFVKNVVASDENKMKKNLQLIIKRVIMCMALFLVKPIVVTTINLLDDLGVDYMQCLEIATSDDLSQYRHTFLDDSLDDSSNSQNPSINNSSSGISASRGSNSTDTSSSGSDSTDTSSSGSDSTNTTPNTGSNNTSINLKSEISSYIKKSAASGTWSVYVKNMKKNEVVEINSTTRMNSASVIKLYVLATAYDKVNLGSLKESKISSDAEVMIKNSDNEATNRIISAVGGKSVVNSYISKNGYSSNTQLNRLLGGNYTSSGIDNYTTSKDVASLLEKIYNRKLVSSKYSDTMLGFLKKQNTRTKIPAGVSRGTVANKTGEISNQGVQNDAAIVYTKNADYVIVVMSTTSDNSKAINNIKEISRIVYQYYNK